MPGRFAHFVALVSLALFVALGVLWIMSLSADRTLRVSVESFGHDASAPDVERHVVTFYYLQAGDSGLAVARFRLEGPGGVPRLYGHDAPAPTRFDWLSHEPPRHPADLWTARQPPPNFPGADRAWSHRRGPFFACRRHDTTVWAAPARADAPMIKQLDEFAAGLPIAIPLALCGVLPWRLAIRRRRVGRWVREGRCRRCGYDVRATPARCPECGAVEPGKAKPGRAAGATGAAHSPHAGV